MDTAWWKERSNSCQLTSDPHTRAVLAPGVRVHFKTQTKCTLRLPPNQNDGDFLLSGSQNTCGYSNCKVTCQSQDHTWGAPKTLKPQCLEPSASEIWSFGSDRQASSLFFHLECPLPALGILEPVELAPIPLSTWVLSVILLVFVHSELAPSTSISMAAVCDAHGFRSLQHPFTLPDPSPASKGQKGVELSSGASPHLTF